MINPLCTLGIFEKHQIYTKKNFVTFAFHHLLKKNWYAVHEGNFYNRRLNDSSYNMNANLPLSTANRT